MPNTISSSYTALHFIFQPECDFEACSHLPANLQWPASIPFVALVDQNSQVLLAHRGVSTEAAAVFGGSRASSAAWRPVFKIQRLEH